MIQYIIAAGIGAFIGSRSKKSKKSYAEGGEVDKIYYADLYRELRFEDMFKSNFPTKPKIRKLYNSRNTNSFGMKREYGIAIGEGRFILKFYYPIEEYRDDDFETAKKIINSFYNKSYAEGGKVDYNEIKNEVLSERGYEEKDFHKGNMSKEEARDIMREANKRYSELAKSYPPRKEDLGMISYAHGGGIGSRFELGTPVNYRTEDYSGNERIESGEVVLRNGKKAIKLYKDSNYSGDGERIRFFDEIDMSQVKNFSGSTYAHGGEVGKLKKYEKQLWRVMQVKGQSRKVKSDTSKEIHRVQEKIKNLQSSTYAEGGLLRVLKDSGFNHHKGSPKNELKHNRGAYIATIGKDNMGEVVHLDIYTPDTKTFISSTSFDNPKKLADYFNKNQLYAKGGKTRKKVKK